ncbi:LLM class flavin-dependent oxidoreductase [Parafrankia sp. FMc6]|uniref:LLM class flavin-dependent oxidoreductase n=1 Tax=Parafrankia soli TaxID=2599596 RepID=UPI0034D6DA89
MKLGIALPNAVPGAPGDAVTTWARRAEECGFDSVAVIDRVVYDSVDPLVALAMAAAVTSRVELVTNVLIAPQHRTALLAKQAASIDRASGGRLTLGVGVGVREDDFAACEIPFRSRGARLDRQLDELRGIWNGEWGIGPAPARPGGPRLLIGGDAALAGPRAARHGGGWTMMVGTPEQFAAGVDTVHRAWREAGRPGTPRTMAVFYAALGEDGPELAAGAIGHYCSWLGADLAGWIAGTAATDEAAVARRVEEFTAAGADEIVIAPCSAEISQLERLAGVALRTPAAV